MARKDDDSNGGLPTGNDFIPANPSPGIAGDVQEQTLTVRESKFDEATGDFSFGFDLSMSDLLRPDCIHFEVINEIPYIKDCTLGDGVVHFVANLFFAEDERDPCVRRSVAGNSKGQDRRFPLGSKTVGFSARWNYELDTPCEPGKKGAVQIFNHFPEKSGHCLRDKGKTISHFLVVQKKSPFLLSSAYTRSVGVRRNGQVKTANVFGTCPSRAGKINAMQCLPGKKCSSKRR